MSVRGNRHDSMPDKSTVREGGLASAGIAVLEGEKITRHTFVGEDKHESAGYSIDSTNAVDGRGEQKMETAARMVDPTVAVAAVERAEPTWANEKAMRTEGPGFSFSSDQHVTENTLGMHGAAGSVHCRSKRSPAPTISAWWFGITLITLGILSLRSFTAR